MVNAWHPMCFWSGFSSAFQLKTLYGSLFSMTVLLNWKASSGYVQVIYIKLSFERWFSTTFQWNLPSGGCSIQSRSPEQMFNQVRSESKFKVRCTTTLQLKQVMLMFQNLEVKACFKGWVSITVHCNGKSKCSTNIKLKASVQGACSITTQWKHRSFSEIIIEISFSEFIKHWN